MRAINKRSFEKLSIISLILTIAFISQLLLPAINVSADIANIDLRLSTNKNVLEEGEEIEFTLEYKTKNGPGAIKKGDILEFNLPEVFSNIKPKYPPEHFSGVEVNGTKVKATFSEGANTAIGGYMRIKAVASDINTEEIKRVTVELNGVIEYIDINVKPIPKPDETPKPNPSPNPGEGTTPPTTVDRQILKQIEPSNSYKGRGDTAEISRPVIGKNIQQVIYVNERKEPLYNTIVFDEMPEGTEFLAETLEINKINKDGTSENVTEQMKPYITADKTRLQLIFNNTDAMYKVQYSMKLTEDRDEYKNTATITDYYGKTEESSTTVKTIEDNTLLKKYSSYDDHFIQDVGSVVSYTLKINPNNRKIKNVSIEDILPKGMELQKESFKIGEYDLEGNFTWVTDKYKHSLEGNRIYIEFGDTDKQYRVYYNAKVVERQKTYTNKAKLSYDLKTTSVENVVRYELNSGAINAEKIVDKSIIKEGDSQKVKYSIEFSSYGYFEKNYINLTDKLDKRVKIEKVEVSDSFSYKIDEESNSVIVKNDKKELDYGEKFFVDIYTDFTNVPDGATIHNVASINSTTTNIVETKKGYSFTAKKVDEDDNSKALKGAKFRLKNKNGQSLSTLVSGENGIITYPIMEPGEYYLEEIKAPEGYILNNKKIKFTIDEKNIGETLDLGFIENKKYKDVGGTTPSLPGEEGTTPPLPGEDGEAGKPEEPGTGGTTPSLPGEEGTTPPLPGEDGEAGKPEEPGTGEVTPNLPNGPGNNTEKPNLPEEGDKEEIKPSLPNEDKSENKTEEKQELPKNNEIKNQSGKTLPKTGTPNVLGYLGATTLILGFVLTKRIKR